MGWMKKKTRREENESSLDVVWYKVPRPCPEQASMGGKGASDGAGCWMDGGGPSKGEDDLSPTLRSTQLSGQKWPSNPNPQTRSSRRRENEREAISSGGPLRGEASLSPTLQSTQQSGQKWPSNPDPQTRSSRRRENWKGAKRTVSHGKSESEGDPLLESQSKQPESFCIGSSF